MSVLTVQNLCKTYPAFTLDRVSFSLMPGKITGLIGRNGAGKSTALKSLLGLVHPDSGKIRFFGLEFDAHQREIKQRLGFVAGGADYYPRKKIRFITGLTRRFYPNWDENAYQDYLDRFQLDENKAPVQLSSGMRVKYALTLALAHRAELLILDEPTSGLDPVSRDDLLEELMRLCGQGVTILFSTHIMSDLERCADQIIYLQKGRILADQSLKSFAAGYRLLELAPEQLTCPERVLGRRRTREGISVLVRAEDAECFPAPGREASLEAIMVHLEGGGSGCSEKSC